MDAPGVEQPEAEVSEAEVSEVTVLGLDAGRCGASVRVRMDPRVARSHTAVMDAARDLLVELGPDGLSVDAVVARSGVAKSTVYRHWSNRDELVADVFSECMPKLEAVDASLSGPDALRDLAGQVARSLADPRWQRLLPALILLKSRSDAMADLNHEMRTAQQDLVASVFQRCVDEGSLDAVVMDDSDRAGLILVGPLLAVALVDGEQMQDAFVDEIVNRFLRAYAPVT